MGVDGTEREHSKIKKSAAALAFGMAVAIQSTALHGGNAAMRTEHKKIDVVSLIRSKNDVFITIDDGWFPNNKVLQLIKDERIPTTTFLIGYALREHKEFWKEYAKYGSIQDHTVDHPFLTRISNREAVYQIKTDKHMIKDVTGSSPYMLRPPYGSYNKYVLDDAAKSGMRYLVMWSAEVPINRYGYINEPFRLETYDGKKLHGGEIILMHWDPGMYKEFKMLMRTIKEDGLKVGSLGAYLRKKT